MSPLETTSPSSSSLSQQEYEVYQDDPHTTFAPNHNTFLYNYVPIEYVEKLYPSHLPRSIQLLRLENIAVPACYLCVGLLQGLSGPFINVYPQFLGASEAQQTSISAIKSLPASFKLAFGFFSDNVPFMGFRRKSYMFIGWAMSSLSMMFLLSFSNLERVSNVANDNEDAVNNRAFSPAEDAPSIPFLTLSLLIFGTGFWFADVMGDSMVAEKAKLEPEESRGQLQSTCYACRFFGLMIAAPVSTVLYSKYGPQIIVTLMALLPMTMLVPIYYLYEVKHAEIKSTREQCSEIWNTVCSRAVWQPMGFVYVYNVLQIGNAAWREFLLSVLLFEDWQLNTLFVIANVLLYLGVMAYKYYFIRYSWRSIYIGTTLLNGFLSMMQILLIQGITFGLSPFVFALGDDIFADFIAGVQFLPTTIMMVHLCPSGSEGASYAMFTTVNNCALGMASALSTVLLGIWDVSKETMVSGDLSGMTKLTILTTCLQTAGLFFVRLLPKTKDDLAVLHADQYSGSKIGGTVFLSVTVLSVMYAIIVNLLNILSPGW
eukprot:CAMPEP_0176493530 /NCGR_PEP_ID=MMETSP0200_2-20121128/9598_1 /TAXON_ID=947934 /ORGANISM="Chaetoceros sp., Strain GSL56" /LENGTH=542 /DNA_ID=CAMNT_0017891199 /DNA_START=225 /DNA_END=1850 /DNA_ORIENTATION=-